MPVAEDSLKLHEHIVLLIAGMEFEYLTKYALSSSSKRADSFLLAVLIFCKKIRGCLRLKRVPSWEF